HAALFQRCRAELQAVRQDRAHRLGHSNLAKFHCGSPRRCPSVVVPAKAGTHLSAARAIAPWIPASAGMTIEEALLEVLSMITLCRLGGSRLGVTPAQNLGHLGE